MQEWGPMEKILWILFAWDRKNVLETYMTEWKMWQKRGFAGKWDDIISSLCPQTLFKEKEEQGNLLICLEGCLTLLQTDFEHGVQEVEWVKICILIWYLNSHLAVFKFMFIYHQLFK